MGGNGIGVRVGAGLGRGWMVWVRWGGKGVDGEGREGMGRGREVWVQVGLGRGWSGKGKW